MYEIYTTLWGVKLDEELNARIQNTEVSEVLYEDEFKPLFREGWWMEVPYSGSGDPDFHFGVQLGTTDGPSGKPQPAREVTDEDKDQFLEFRSAWLKVLDKAVKTSHAREPFDAGQLEAIHDWKVFVASAEPGTHVCYSTS